MLQHEAHAATYPIGVAASAADCPQGTLGRWFESGVIKVLRGDFDGSPGIARQLSLRRVLQIAVTRQLHKLGVAPQRAADAALVWSDQGAPGIGPGEVFPNGQTFLAIDDAGPRVINVDADASVAEVMRTAAGWQPGASILVDLRRLRDRVVSRLKDESASDFPLTPPFLRLETK